MTIDTIIFDFGGVIYQTPGFSRLAKLQRIFRIKVDPEIMTILKDPEASPVFREVCLGKIPENEFWVMVAERLGVNSRLFQYFHRKFTSKRNMNQPMVDFLRGVSQKFKVGILSNAGDQTRSIMENIFHLDQYVDDIIISAEEALIKPDRKIYQLALDRLGAVPETSLFVDDRLVNVQAAQDFGMKAVQFINTEQAIAEMNGHLDGRG